jgi:hypothetical protein
MKLEHVSFSYPVVLFAHRIKGMYVIRLGFLTGTALGLLNYATLLHCPSFI